MYVNIGVSRVITILYTAIFSLRRLLLVLFLLWLQERNLVVLSYAYFALYSLNFWYLTHAWPNLEKGINYLECFNELCLIGLNYIMIFFMYGTKVSPHDKWNAGLVAIVVIVVIYVTNICYLIVTTVTAICHRAKLSAIKRANIRKYRLAKVNRCLIKNKKNNTPTKRRQYE